MELHEYPRPADDTGIGVHWCAGVSAAALEMVEAFWLRELNELGVKWVKIADQRGALQLSKALLAAQIMPIVQVVRETAGPGPLLAEELEEVERLVEAGVRYFELDSEPDGAAFWGRSGLPEDALAVTARAAAANMEAVLERGGLPAIPALTPAGDWQLVEEIARAGGEALFDQPIWLAIHNYSSNRPPHYPDDAVHSEGEPQPQLPPERVHWRAFERLNDEVVRLIGRSLPILSTANGYLINENADPRYPATTPMLHTAQTLEICRAMMGTGRHTPPAPGYYFCTAFWLLAHGALAGEGPVDEQSAWYSPERRGVSEPLSLPAGPAPVAETFGWTTLPIVPLLKAEPKRPRARDRRERGAPQAPVTGSRYGFRPTGNGVLSGKVRGGAGAQVRLTHSDGFAYETIARTSGVYRFVDLPAGRYSLEVTDPAGSRVEAIELGPAQESVCDLTAYGWGFEIEQRTVLDDGMLICDVEFLPNPTGAESGTDEGGRRTRPPALRISDGAQKSWVVPLARSSQAQTAQCETGPLAAGSYQLEILGLPDSGPAPLKCEVSIEVGMETRVLFAYAYDEKRAAPRASEISGSVAGGKGCTVRLRAEEPGGGPGERLAEVDGDGGYLFSGLAAGRYYVDVKQRRLLNWPRPLVLDGRNRPRCDLILLPEETLPALPEPAVLQGRLQPQRRMQPGTAGASARARQPLGGSRPSQQVALVDAQRQRYVTQVEPSGAFRFESLPAGDYDLYAEGFGSWGIHLDAGDRLSIQLWQTEEGWRRQTRIQTGAAAPGMIRAQWAGRADLTIIVTNADSGMEELDANEAGEAEPSCSAEFGPFPPGAYLVHCPELAISAEVELAAGEAAVVSFVGF
ncbi:MAG: carboxypeptidase regulatory-like domain-containing protein [Caldilineaceae bacterium SB0661_bin_32]|uniref:Carboxypeptidase regulatory-like domain-containing protein n=1 Tax=Caldilineaceae bacterium SB0661_bin_32 TaxID=2605255 RepID=A0A6B1D7Q7_9CHLR|nr:carboxypeptidase regulatory-like domain-containing protein [Caldilineaceae bacterium SB0661_bin_32]